MSQTRVSPSILKGERRRSFSVDAAIFFRKLPSLLLLCARSLASTHAIKLISARQLQAQAHLSSTPAIVVEYHQDRGFCRTSLPKEGALFLLLSFKADARLVLAAQVNLSPSKTQ